MWLPFYRLRGIATASGRYAIFGEDAVYESARKLPIAFNFQMLSDYRKLGKPVAIRRANEKLLKPDSAINQSCSFQP
jgi:hypothetical protein